MKVKILSLFVILLLSSCIWQNNDDDFIPVSRYTPVVLTRTDFEASVVLEDVKPINETGKIYVKGDYLFINEPHIGFHIVNNSDPTNPIFLNFLSAPGATDLIFKEDVFYINQAVDLIAVKFIDNLTAVQLTKRVKNVLSKISSPDGFSHFTNENEVVTNWTLN